MEEFGESVRPACVDHRRAWSRLHGACGLVPAFGKRARRKGTRAALWQRRSPRYSAFAVLPLPKLVSLSAIVVSLVPIAGAPPRASAFPLRVGDAHFLVG